MHGDTSAGRELRIAGLFAILATSAIGVSLPLLSRGRFPAALFVARCFGAGVVIATGFAHVSQACIRPLSPPPISPFLHFCGGRAAIRRMARAPICV